MLLAMCILHANESAESAEMGEASEVRHNFCLIVSLKEKKLFNSERTSALSEKASHCLCCILTHPLHYRLSPPLPRPASVASFGFSSNSIAVAACLTPRYNYFHN